MPPVPKHIRLLAFLVGIAISLSALALAIAAVTLPLLAPGERPAWMLFGFELVVLVTGILVALFGRGRFADGPGLALGTLAGTLVIASAFGWIATGRQVAGVALFPVLAFRLVSAAALAAAGAYCVLSRNPRSWRLFAIGCLCGLPCAAAAVAFLLPAGRRSMLNFISGGGIFQTSVALILLIALGCLLCASGHLIINAFELGRTDAAAPPATPAAAKTDPARA
jgi:hypothetical protein